MNRAEMEKLLGGYATGTLTETERQALFAAALEDQELFDALAREQALKDLLAEPAARARVLAALGEAKPPLAERLWRWLPRPAAMALAGVAAAAVIVVAVLVPRREPVRERPLEMAQVRQPEMSAPGMPSAVPAPAQRPAERQSFRESRADQPAKAKAAAPAAAGRTNAIREADQDKRAEAAALQAMPAAGLASDAGGVAPPRGAAGGGPGGVPREAEAIRPAAKGRREEAAVKAEAVPPARPQGAVGVVGGVPGGVVGGILGGVPSSAPAPGMLARTRYVADSAAGVDYTVLRRDEDGRFTAPAAGAALRTGDEIRMRLEAHVTGWLYLLEREGAGWRKVAGAKVEMNRPVVLPAEGFLRYAEPGPKELYLVLARTEPVELRVAAVAALPAGAVARRVVLEVAAR